MKFILLSFAFLCTFSLSAQQVIGFEDRVPEEFTSPDKKSLSLSNRYYKEGKKSLEWNFVPGSTMYVALDAPLVLNNKTEATHGITLWIYSILLVYVPVAIAWMACLLDWLQEHAWR